MQITRELQVTFVQVCVAMVNLYKLRRSLRFECFTNEFVRLT